MVKSHELRVGDIIFGVDGVERDELRRYRGAFHQAPKEGGRLCHAGRASRRQTNPDALEDIQDEFSQMIHLTRVMFVTGRHGPSSDLRAGDWTTPVEVRHEDTRCLSYRARLSGPVSGRPGEPGAGLAHVRDG